MLLLAGFTLGFAYMGWSSYRLIVPCMHGRVRFRPFSTAHTRRRVPYNCMSFAAKVRGKPGYTVDGGGTELYGLVRMFTEYTCRHVAVGGLYTGLCLHGLEQLPADSAVHARQSPFSSVFHATKKAVQIFAPLEKHLKSVGIELIGSRHTVKLIFTGSDIAAEEKHIGYSRVIT